MLYTDVGAKAVTKSLTTLRRRRTRAKSIVSTASVDTNTGPFKSNEYLAFYCLFVLPSS